MADCGKPAAGSTNDSFTIIRVYIFRLDGRKQLIHFFTTL